MAAIAPPGGNWSRSARAWWYTSEKCLGWSVGWSVGRLVGRLVCWLGREHCDQCAVAWPHFNVTSERINCTYLCTTYVRTFAPRTSVRVCVRDTCIKYIIYQHHGLIFLLLCCAHLTHYPLHAVRMAAVGGAYVRVCVCGAGLCAREHVASRLMHFPSRHGPADHHRCRCRVCRVCACAVLTAKCACARTEVQFSQRHARAWGMCIAPRCEATVDKTHTHMRIKRARMWNWFRLLWRINSSITKHMQGIQSRCMLAWFVRWASASKTCAHVRTHARTHDAFMNVILKRVLLRQFWQNELSDSGLTLVAAICVNFIIQHINVS